MVLQNEACDVDVPWPGYFGRKDFAYGYDCVRYPSDEDQAVGQRCDNHGGLGRLIGVRVRSKITIDLLFEVTEEEGSNRLSLPFNIPSLFQEAVLELESRGNKEGGRVEPGHYPARLGAKILL